MIGFFQKNRKETVFVLEESAQEFFGTAVSVDYVKKTISFSKSKTYPRSGRWKKPFIPPHMVVLAFSPFRATTVECAVAVRRGNAEKNIDAGEIDHLISEALWRFLSRYRIWAAKKMNVSDAELTLADIHIRNVSLDGKNVFNPEGFKGKQIIFSFRGTFIPRGEQEMIERARKISKTVRVVEAPWAYVFSFPEDCDYACFVEDTVTHAYRKKNGERAYYKTWRWGDERIVKALVSEFGISFSVSRELFRRYVRGGFSERFRRAVGAAVRNEYERLFRTVRVFPGRSGKNVPVRIAFRYPYSRAPQAESSAGCVIADERKWARAFGWDAGFRAFPPFRDRSLALFLAVHPHTVPQYNFLNRLLVRRAKWLIPYRNEGL